MFLAGVIHHVQHHVFGERLLKHESPQDFKAEVCKTFVRPVVEGTSYNWPMVHVKYKYF